MRFQRSDLPGIAVATLAGPLLFVLFLASFETWDHHGTPLLGFTSSNIAIGAGLLAVFTRFIRSWDVPIALLVVLVAVVVAVNWLQRTDNDGTALATTLKWVGVIDFLLLNLAFAFQVMVNGLFPVLDRRSARRAAAQEAAAEAAAAELAAAQAES